MSNEDSDLAKEQAEAQYAAVVRMVAALDVDYDRLAELRALRLASEITEDDAEELTRLEALAGECESEEDAIDQIRHDALEFSFRSGWSSDPTDLQAEEYSILLCFGGPAVRIVGELQNGEPVTAYLEYQDWGTPWTEYHDGNNPDALLRYAQYHVTVY